jgi:putative nucleotidyltransferase with HDIG domain
MPDKILIVDDETHIRDLLAQKLVSSGFETDTAKDGFDALKLIHQNGYRLVLSDVNMPGLSGLQMLEYLKRLNPDLPVVMLSAVKDISTLRHAVREGAYDYLLKPCDYEELLKTVKRGLERSRLVRENKEYQVKLEERVADQNVQLANLYVDTVTALVSALDSREHETANHSLRVTLYALTLAEQVGVSKEQLPDIIKGALLHDVGKIGVPDHILLKPGKLTPEEWVEMRKHPQIGYDMLKNIKFLEKAVEVVYCHQEKFDGTGYPQGLAGEGIPIGARVFAVADTLDAMTSDRVYRKALSYDIARAEMIKYSGTQFDPQVVNAFLEIPATKWDEIKSVAAESDALNWHRFF